MGTSFWPQKEGQRGTGEEVGKVLRNSGGRGMGMNWDSRRCVANQNIGCPVKLDFQINYEYIFSISISPILHGAYCL